jgi:hypothetical protein
VPSALAIQESIGHYTGYSGLCPLHGPRRGRLGPRIDLRLWAPASGRARGMEPAKRQVTNRKVASVRSGCQWGSFLR